MAQPPEGSLRLLSEGSPDPGDRERPAGSLQTRRRFPAGTAPAPYPFSLREADSTVGDLLKLGPFPEPLLSGSARTARRWSRAYRSQSLAIDSRGCRGSGADR
jgi:hypothetical protein